MKLFNVYKFDVLRQKKSFFIWTAVLTAVTLLFYLLFPLMETSEMSAMMQTVFADSEDILKVLNMNGFPDFSDLTEYLAYCSQYIGIALCVYAAILGTTSLIREESEGTIELLYSKPIKRSGIVSMKIMSAMTNIILVNLVLFVVNVIMCSANSPSPAYDFMTYLVSSTGAMLLAQITYFALGIMISTVLKRARAATPIALLLFFGLYIIGVVSKFVEDLAFIESISPFNSAAPANFVSGFGIEVPSLIIMGIMIIGGTMIAYMTYNEKDMQLI